MQKMKIIVGLVGLLVLSGCGYDCPSKETVKSSVQKIMPVNFDVVEIKGIRDIPGLCEVIITVDKQPVTFYVDRKSRYIMSGSMVEVESGKNITLEGQKAYKH